MENSNNDLGKPQKVDIRIPEAKEKKEKSFKRFIQEEADDLSAIGVRHCYDGKRSRLRRGIWLILVVLGVIVAITLVTDRFQKFFSYPVSTSLDIITEKSLHYPKITICNANQIQKSVAEKLGLLDYFKQFSFPYYLNESDPIIEGPTPNYTQKLRTDLSPRAEQIKCSLKETLCPEIVYTTTYTTYGRCVTIDLNLANETIFKAGSLTGVEFVLFSQEDEYFVTKESFSGFTVLLHNALDPPRVDEFGLKIQLGHENSVSFSVVKLQRSPSPYGHCEPKPGYNKLQCDLDCITEHVILTCGCRPAYMPGTERECNFYEDRCVEREMHRYMLLKSRDERTCDCPPICDETIYNPSISTAQFSNVTMKEFLRQLGINISYKYFADNFAIMKVYINQMEVTRITTSPSYTFYSLLSDIGGALSLMLGATLLTIVEVFEMGINTCMFLCSRKKKYEVNKVSENNFQNNKVVENNIDIEDSR